MNKETLINEILKAAGRPDTDNIDIELWVAAEIGPEHPRYRDWIAVCRSQVDAYQRRTGLRDRDSIFARYLREYGDING